MAGVLPYSQAVDIGGGRGRLAGPAAASLARVDAAMRSAFGRAADINEAWRSPEDADENYRKYRAWLAYQNGTGPKVPWAPIALPADQSIHCRGYAVDTDDTSDEQMRIWNDNGWFWTVYRWINGVWTLMERWHLEYDINRDNHRHEGVPAFVAVKPKEWDEMASKKEFSDALAEEFEKFARLLPMGGMRTPIKAGDGSLALVGEFSAQVLTWPADAELWRASLWALGNHTGDIHPDDVLSKPAFDLLVANANANGERFRAALGGGLS